MNQPTRLFDAVEWQLQRFAKTDMLAEKKDGTWVTYTTQQVKDLVDKLTAGLLQLGLSAKGFDVEAADKIAIISNNRPEWIITDIAVQQTGAILVPLFPTTNPNEISFILNEAEVKYVFLSSKDLLKKIKAIQHEIPSLQNIYTFDKIENENHWSELLQSINEDALSKINDTKAAIPASHVATIIYTSGTTGVPKGVMLTHENIVSDAYMSKASFPFNDEPGYKALSILPLNHIFEKCVSYIYLFSGIGIYFAQSLETIGDNLKEIKPDCFMTVPRLLEKVFDKIMATGKKLTGIKRKLFDWSIDLGLQYDNNKSGGIFYNMQLSIANKLVFSKWREALGNNIKFIVTGGAACPVKLIRIFNAAQIPLYEGYGPTENSPVISVNRTTKGGNVFGTIGEPIEGLEVKLEEDGEICVKGSTVMKGYYKRPELTAETIIDGWLHTGDVGQWINNNFLKITDRKKELFKTSGGKYVAPQPIENKLKESIFIEQAIVIGAEQKFTGALIVPAFEQLKIWMKENKLDFTTNESAVTNPAVLAHYRTIINEYNKHFNPVEEVKKFRLLNKDWSIESGELTPKMSVRRKVVMEKFKNEIDKIYS